MNQRRIDDFYTLNRFRDVLTRATAGCEHAGLVLDVPATVRKMAAKHSARLKVEHDAGGLLTVSNGPDCFFNVHMHVDRAPAIGLVRETVEG